ncbi:XAC0095 family protein [Coralloluteibacterium stylophorae]|uniref:XAC0095-like domain-containing protein n=1 Tax=Coralloluteibacterium stylophorae TaxID=1776034 RepID=A0A8J7VUM2_9GAMM|nr:hypothetical protein [Coralloluteibacterium stylophorae]MBS7455721.1 hypothetical protein [Coralloluteibacterium stylophorae]
MSTYEFDDLGMPGYFLPEDSQLRLAQLRDHIGFLAGLARPRVPDGRPEGAPEIGTGELAFCLELLAEQVGRVLDEVSWPAVRGDGMGVAGDAGPDGREEADAAPAGGFGFRVTVDQLDALVEQLQTLSAHGDVLAAGVNRQLEGATLATLGEAVHDAAQAVRGVLREVEGQWLGDTRGFDSRVEEGRAEYRVWVGWPGAPAEPAEPAEPGRLVAA